MPNTRNRKSQRKSNRRQNKKSQRKSNRRQNRKSLRKSNKKQTRQLRNKLGGNENNKFISFISDIKNTKNELIKKNVKNINEYNIEYNIEKILTLLEKKNIFIDKLGKSEYKNYLELISKTENENKTEIENKEVYNYVEILLKLLDVDKKLKENSKTINNPVGRYDTKYEKYEKEIIDTIKNGYFVYYILNNIKKVEKFIQDINIENKQDLVLIEYENIIQLIIELTENSKQFEELHEITKNKKEEIRNAYEEQNKKIFNSVRN